MRAFLPLAALLTCSPAASPDLALRRETAFNSLQRFMLPRLPRGSVCDVAESADPAFVACFLEFAVDLDSPRCTSVRAAFLREMKAAGLDPAKLDPGPERLAEVMAKAVWPPHYEQEAKGRYAELLKKLDVEAPELRVGAAIDVTFNGWQRQLSHAPGAKDWHFVMP